MSSGVTGVKLEKPRYQLGLPLHMKVKLMKHLGYCRAEPTVHKPYIYHSAVFLLLLLTWTNASLIGLASDLTGNRLHIKNGF